MKNAIDSRAVDTILERPISIAIGGRKFEASRPTTATVIAVSEYISELPKTKLSDEDVLTEVLAIAPDCKPLGKIAAILLLGVDAPKSTSFWRKRRKSKQIDRLAEDLLCSLTPGELKSLIGQMLDIRTITDFFALTTSLTEVNLLRARKAEEVETRN